MEPTTTARRRRDVPRRLLGSAARHALPGDRRVWLVAGAIGLVLLVLLLQALLKPREYLTGSNSAAPVGAVAIVDSGQRLCVRDVRIPAGTGRVRFRLDTRTAPRPPLRLELRTADGGRVIRTTLPGSQTPGFRDADFPIPTTRAAPFLTANVCITPLGGTVFAWGRPLFMGNDVRPVIDGKPTPTGRVSLWFLGPPGVEKRIAEQLPAIFRRAALFRPGFVGAWTYWALFLVGLPLLSYAGIRLLATAGSSLRRRVPLTVLVALLAFLNAGAWALVTPAFQSPDESEHFVYAQYLAETGHAVDATPSDRPLYSSAESIAVDAVHLTGVIERPEAKPPWLPVEVQDWRERIAAQQRTPPQDDGGGFHPAISSHTPLYYGLLAPAYWAAHGDSVFSQLLWMRLVSALLGALVAAMAYLTVRELLPREPALAVAAGLLVAFQPMFTFISGAINNDNGVNAAAAVAIYLVVRALKRGLSPAVAAGIGAALVVASLMKGTGYELYPPVVLALAYLMWRQWRASRAWYALAAGLATVVALQLGWKALAPVFHRPVFTTPGGVTPGVGFAAYHDPASYLSWLWQVLVPVRLPFMQNYTIVHWPFYNIYVKRGFGSFGWYAIEFPPWLYLFIVAVVVALAVLGVRALWRFRAAALDRAGAIGFLVLVPVAVICAVEAAYLPVGGLPIDGTAEQGRYAFPAIVAVAAIAAGSCLGAGRRRAVPVAGALVAAMMGLAFASRLLTLSTFFS